MYYAYHIRAFFKIRTLNSLPTLVLAAFVIITVIIIITTTTTTTIIIIIIIIITFMEYMNQVKKYNSLGVSHFYKATKDNIISSCYMPGQTFPNDYNPRKDMTF